MAHAAPPTPRHRTTERVLGSALVVIGIAILAVAFVALKHPKGREAPRATVSQTGTETGATPPKSPTKPKPSGSKPTTAAATSTNSATSKPFALVVLDNTASEARIATARSRFESAGWSVTATGAFDGDILSTAAYYDPNITGALDAATELQREFPAIQRVKERFDGLPAGPIIVVLTTDYS